MEESLGCFKEALRLKEADIVICIITICYIRCRPKIHIKDANSGKCVWTGVNVGMSDDWCFEDESS